MQLLIDIIKNVDKIARKVTAESLAVVLIMEIAYLS